MALRYGLAICIWAVMVTASLADWIKIGPGPDLEYAMAYCDNASMGVDRPLPPRNNIIINVNPYGTNPYYGNPYANNDGWAQLGNGLGNLMRRSRFKKNCMVMNGWKEVRAKSSGKSEKGKSCGNPDKAC